MVTQWVCAGAKRRGHAGARAGARSRRQCDGGSSAGANTPLPSFAVGFRPGDTAADLARTAANCTPAAVMVAESGVPASGALSTAPSHPCSDPGSTQSASPAGASGAACRPAGPGASSPHRAGHVSGCKLLAARRLGSLSVPRVRRQRSGSLPRRAVRSELSLALAAPRALSRAYNLCLGHTFSAMILM
jgi:hypothetical protein